MRQSTNVEEPDTPELEKRVIRTVQRELTRPKPRRKTPCRNFAIGALVGKPENSN
jgi:hypothetical protein